ncbi:MAG: SMC-Scp complex subunit ScpB [Mycoplasma sp.]
MNNDNKNKKPIDETEENNNLDLLFDFAPIGTIEEKEKTKKEKLNMILEEDFLEDFKGAENPKIEVDHEIFEEVLFSENENNIQENKTQLINFSKIKSLIESALYVCGNDGVSLNELKKLTDASPVEIRKIIKEMMNEYDTNEARGLTIKLFGDKYKLFSKPENRESLSKLITLKYRNPLSNKVMETLAIIAYNQPCTKAIIQDIRAKDPTVTIQKLLDLELIVEAGRSDSPGRPFLYTVSHKFYNIFGIKNVSDLPTINLDQPFHDDEVSFFDTNRFNE